MTETTALPARGITERDLDLCRLYFTFEDAYGPEGAAGLAREAGDAVRLYAVELVQFALNVYLRDRESWDDTTNAEQVFAEVDAHLTHGAASGTMRP